MTKYKQEDACKFFEGNYRNYIMDKLTCEIMENKPFLDVVFINSASGIFFSKTLVSI